MHITSSYAHYGGNLEWLDDSSNVEKMKPCKGGTSKSKYLPRYDAQGEGATQIKAHQKALWLWWMLVLFQAIAVMGWRTDFGG